MELELTGVRVRDSEVNLAFVGFLPFVSPPLAHFPHGMDSGSSVKQHYCEPWEQ